MPQWSDFDRVLDSQPYSKPALNAPSACNSSDSDTDASEAPDHESYLQRQPGQLYGPPSVARRLQLATHRPKIQKAFFFFSQSRPQLLLRPRNPTAHVLVAVAGDIH